MISRSLFPTCVVGLLVLGGNARAQTDVPPPAPEASPAPVEAPPPAPPPPVVEVAPPPPPGPPSFKIEPSPGNTLKVGLLLQPQFLAQGDPEHTLNGYDYNLYLRRTRILVGGTVLGAFDYFLDTDYPNLFLAAPEAMGTATTKATPGMNIQDAFITYRPLHDLIKVDAGYMLPPLAHNAVQGAGTLYSWDYFSFSFLTTANTLLGSSASPVGRDLGVQLRGLVLDGHLEYRVGLFQGLRESDSATDIGSNNMFRASGRVQINFLDPEPGFFYAGTYLGKKKILSIGGTFDTQSSYHYYGGDLFADLPLGPGVFTAQINVVQFKGGTFIPTLPKETAFMGEAGYNIDGIRLNPIVRVEHLWAAADQTRAGGGLAFWAYGHTSNLKLFYMHNSEQNTAHAQNQVVLQWQLYFL